MAWTKPSDTESVHFDTKLLRFLISVADEGSVTKAAEKHYLSQPAMSRYVCDMENTLGVRLFVRQKRHLVLTDAGKLFINGARSIVYLEEQMEQNIRKIKLEEEGTGLRMLVPPALHSLFYEALSSWNGDAVSLGVDTGDHIRQSLQHGAADLGVFAWDDDSERLFPHEELFRSPLAICLPDPKDSQLSENVGPAEILSHGVLIISHDSCLHIRQIQVLKTYGITHPNMLAIADEGLLLELASAGHGPVILPMCHLTDIAPHRLFPLPDTEPVPFHACTAPGLHSASATDFLRHLHQFVSRQMKGII